ncbi:MAG: aldo/keto reductase [Herpetosiphonaceae bacterium]|nr:aldo/keto reductase [Herpetosiphonaceae bacterium]
MTLPTLPFGRLGHPSTRTLFGAAALGSVSQDDADRTLDVLLNYGVNHIDVAASYGDAELRIAPWLKRYRDHFFVATKTGERRAAAAREELHRSLDRMGIDHIDLWQFHNLAAPIEWDIALSPGGVIETAIEAKQQGLIGGIGITGHGLQIAATHQRSLERFDFDSVLLPYNYPTMQSDYYAGHFKGLVTTCQERNVAVQTIKSIAAAPWMGQEHTRSTWYKPLEKQEEIDAAVWWVLARPGIFLNTVGDITLLAHVLDAANRFNENTSQSEIEERVSSLSFEPLFV